MTTFSPFDAADYLTSEATIAEYLTAALEDPKPGDLPIEQPTKFELVVNLKTATAIGVTFPEAFMVRVDRVIE